MYEPDLWIDEGGTMRQKQTQINPARSLVGRIGEPSPGALIRGTGRGHAKCKC